MVLHSGDEPPAPPEPRWARRQIQDLVALILIVVGVVGIVTVAFLWHVLAGWAATFAVIATFGVYMGIE